MSQRVSFDLEGEVVATCEGENIRFSDELQRVGGLPEVIQSSKA